MQYTMQEIREFLARPEFHKKQYTQRLLNELIGELYSFWDGIKVRYELMRVYRIVDYWNKPKKLVQREGLRIPIAVVHLSADSSGKGDFEKLKQNIVLAEGDYRDLLKEYD